MADNIAVLDGAGVAVTVKSTDTAGVHTPHHNVDKVGGQTPAYNAGAAGAAVPRVVTASDSPEVTALGAVADAAVTNPASNGSVIALLKGLISVVGTTLVGFVDGLEALIGSTNTKLDTIAGHLDGVEGKLDTLARQPTSVKRLVSAGGSTNADFAKAAAGTLFEVIGYNAAASVRYLKIFNKASAPTVGSDTPVLTIPLPPAAAFAIDFPALPFATGIAFCLTTGVADADTGALTAADVVGLNILYA